MKDLRSMTVKEIKAYMKENNISVDRAYKMKKEELIVAIEIGIEDEKIFDPDKSYVFSKEKYLQKVNRTSGKRTKENLLEDKEIMEWLNRIDGKEVKTNSYFSNTVYVENKEFESFGRELCVEKIEAATLENKDEKETEIELKEGMVVHCPTEEQANQFLKACDKQGIVWEVGKSATTHNYWEDLYKQDTCYAITSDKILKFSHVGYFKEKGFEIIEFKDLIIKKASIHPVDLNKVDEVKVDSGILNFIEDGTKVKVKLKDFKDKSKYFREDIGTLETDHLTGYKSVKIKNNYRTRHIPINNKNVEFFISRDDLMKFSLMIYEKEREKNQKKDKKIVACRC